MPAPSDVTVQDVLWEFFRRWVCQYETFEEAATRLGILRNRVSALVRQAEGRFVGADHIQAIANIEGLSPSDLFLQLTRVAVELQANPSLVTERLKEMRVPRPSGKRPKRLHQSGGAFIMNEEIAEELGAEPVERTRTKKEKRGGSLNRAARPTTPER
jgi:hypothetical protein